VHCFAPWLFTVARNVASRYFAKLSREIPTVDLSELDYRLQGPLSTAAGEQDFELRDCMTLLEPRERELMRLRFIEGWEYHEIAAARGIPIGTVQWRVFNSKKSWLRG
jgi:RNA polymerase sigma-70 factor (ECF subfamily)